jgi:hypothetical protein
VAVPEPSADLPPDPSAAAPATPPRQETWGHDSRIMPVDKPDGLLILIVVLVVLLIFCNAIVGTIVFGLAIALLIATPWLTPRRRQLPPWLVALLDPLWERLRTFPGELVLLVLVAGLIALKWLPEEYPRLTQLSICVVLVVSHWMSRYISLLRGGYRHGRLGRWCRRLLTARAEPPGVPSPSVTALLEKSRLQPPDTDTTETQVMSRHNWEQRQQQRWEEWMQEELDRLDGEYGDKNGKP